MRSHCLHGLLFFLSPGVTRVDNNYQTAAAAEQFQGMLNGNQRGAGLGDDFMIASGQVS
ncbi:hypothetical protein P378_00400 [Desulforamulus profundi]|uniref:Uncharacterized protein n=1 Tax=Desulforamulus profundi TaxID=1383067 RepID=A0A2C6LMU1_9FIRM|nr:hypothetical protein P378_00400 [Desulforamulus profundi]